jgi:cation:H+ antiporter
MEFSLNSLTWIGDGERLHEFIAGSPTAILLLLIVVCIVVLVKGADWMIDGAVDLARRTGLPRIVIGATIVSLGTTTPEAVVSVMAAWMGNPGLALGNGVGSIIADTGLIFGLTCMLTRVPMNRYILDRTGWVQVGAATLLVLIAVAIRMVVPGDPILSRWVGVLFLLLLAGYLYCTYIWSRQGSIACADEEALDVSTIDNIWKCWGCIVGGLIMVVSGARLLVPCAAEMALRVGVPNDIIAATLVAFGTSLPELITAITSVRKGCPEITVGNIVGADVLNCLFVIGAAAAAKPLVVTPNFFVFHFPAMLIVLYSFRIFIMTNRNGRFARWHGSWLLSIYLLYVILQYAFGIGTVEG